MVNRTLVFLFFLVAAFILMAWLFTSIFLYVSIALVFTTIMRPLTNFLSKSYIFKVKVPRALAILVSYALTVMVIALFVLLFIPLIIEQTEVLSKLSFDVIYENLSGPLVSLEQFLVDNGIMSADQGLTTSLKTTIIEFVSDVNFRAVLNNLLSITGSFFVSILAIAFITFFLLYEDGILRRQMIAVVPNQYFEMFISAMFKVEKLLSNYLIGLMVQMFSIFSVAALGLSLFGVNYALTIAVFAALANLIPYLGPLLGALFGIFVGLSTSGHFAVDQVTIILIAKIVSVFAIVQATDNVFLQPLIFSKSVKAHPLEIFVVIFAAATIAGIPGMIAAIPVYTILRVSTVEISSGFRRFHIFQPKGS